MRKHDVITIGSATQDTYIQSSGYSVETVRKKEKKWSEIRFPLGPKLEAKNILLEVGGGATNAAATFVSFGLRTACLSTVGDDPSGAFVLEELRKLGVGVDHIRIQRGGRTGFSLIFLTKNGDRTIFVYRGDSGNIDTTSSYFRSAFPKWIYLTSIAGQKKHIRDVFSKRTHGTNIAWNPGKAELAKSKGELKSFFSKPDVLLLNKEEAGLLFGTNQTAITSRFIRRFTKSIVVITYAEKGSVCFAGSRTFRCKIRPVKPKDTTGAGDAFGSGFVAGIMKKPGDVAYALTIASANAMSEILTIGAKQGLLKQSQLSKFINRIRITR